MESLPTLDSLHQALVAENALEAEEELLSVMTHLLVCAIEDPGVPNPNRHTTLLGQSLRQADLTNANISEVLRIYLYAIATGEVRQMTRISFERERERRVADHHQVEVMDFSSSKNSQYYEVLHENTTWKLSEQLRDKPFVSLSPPLKAQILAHLCNDLLMNKAVLKQIEGSLESANQMRKDRYLMDAKIRKCRSTHQRKVRMSQFLAEAERFEKAKQEQLLAKKNAEEQQQKELLEKEKLVNGNVDEEVGQEKTVGDEADAEAAGNKSTDSENDSVVAQSTNGETTKASPETEGKQTVQEETPKAIEKAEETTTTTTTTNTTISPPPATTTTAKATANGSNNKSTNEIELELSDEESSMPILDIEDEDERLSVDELAKKLDKLEKQAAHNQEVFETSIKQLRGQHMGQDRYWRRFWNLPKAGGIYVEAMESAQSEIMRYNELLEAERERERAIAKDEPEATEEEEDEEEEDDDRPKQQPQDGDIEMKDEDEEQDTAANRDSDSESADESQEKNGFEAEVKPDVVNGEATNDPKQRQEDEKVKTEPEQMDIEESIPSMLVQKKPNGTLEGEDKSSAEAKFVLVGESAPVKIESMEGVIKSESVVKAEDDEVVMKEIQSEVKPEIVIVEDSVDNDIKKEVEEEEEKWFSIVNREVPLDSTESPASYATQVLYNNVSCEAIVQMQGHRWDIVNNLQYYNTSTLDLPTPSDVTVATETILTPSGLKEEIMARVLAAEDVGAVLREVQREENERGESGTGCDKSTKASSLVPVSKLMTEEFVQHGYTIPPFLTINLPNITNYLQCDNSVPLSMTEEEERILEVIKEKGWPKKNCTNFVPKRLRHGWWKINDKELAETLADVLLLRGVRERGLRTNLLNVLAEGVDFSQSCPLGPLDASESIADVEFVEPGTVAPFNPRIIVRVEMALLEQIESLEDKIASASMQNKGWAAPTRDSSEATTAAAAALAAASTAAAVSAGNTENGEEVTGVIAPVAVTVDHSISMMRERILDLEAAIERRYLKPPLGNNVGEVSLAMLAQNQDGTTTTSTATTTSGGTATGNHQATSQVNASPSSSLSAMASGSGGVTTTTNCSAAGGGQQVPSSQQSNHSDQTEDGSEPENISKGELGEEEDLEKNGFN